MRLSISAWKVKSKALYSPDRMPDRLAFISCFYQSCPSDGESREHYYARTYLGPQCSSVQTKDCSIGDSFFEASKGKCTFIRFAQ